MPADLPQTQHDRPQRQYRSTRVRQEDQKIVQERENAGQTTSKQPEEKERAAQTDPINAIRTLFLILCISLVGYALIRQYHGSDTEQQPEQQMVSPGGPVTSRSGN